MNRDDDRGAAEVLEAYVAARLEGENVSPPADIPLAAKLLDLAETLEPDPDFAADLESRLHGAATHPPALLTHWRRLISMLRRQMMHRRTVLTLAGVAALILLGLFGPSVFPALFQGPTPVSAAEILRRTDAYLAVPLDETAVLYDRLSLDWKAATTQRDVVAELWQAPTGDRFRYQLTDANGNLLFFLQRDGERIWRSVHARPVGAEAVTHIYEMSLEAYRAQVAAGPSPVLARPGSSLPLFFSELSTAWPVLGQLIRARSEACADLSCLFGVPEGDWSCEGQDCTLPVDGGSLFVQARVTQKTLDDGRPVYVVELVYPDVRTRVLQIDAESFGLVEITDYHQGKMVTRLRHLERQALSGPGAQVFDAFPEGVEVVEPDEAGAATDRVWIVSATPHPGTTLRGDTQFEVVIGYELASVPQAALEVVLARPGCYAQPKPSCTEMYEGNRLPIVGGSENISITAGEGEVTARFNINPSEETWLKPGDLALGVMLFTWEGATRINPLLNQEFTDYYWVFP